MFMPSVPNGEEPKGKAALPFGKLLSARRKLLRHGAMLFPFGQSVSFLANSYNQSKYKYKNPYARNRKYNQVCYNRYGYRAQAQQNKNRHCDSSVRNSIYGMAASASGKSRFTRCCVSVCATACLHDSVRLS